MAPPVGLEPTTPSLTARCSTIELQGNKNSRICGRNFSFCLYEKLHPARWEDIIIISVDTVQFHIIYSIARKNQYVKAKHHRTPTSRRTSSIVFFATALALCAPFSRSFATSAGFFRSSFLFARKFEKYSTIASVTTVFNSPY